MINVILTLIAFLLVGVFTPFSILWTLILHPRKLSDYFWRFAIALDQLGNVTCQYTLNFVFIKKDGVLCGNEDQTVSYVIGANKQKGTLTKAGIYLAKILNKIEKDHVEKAVENESQRWK
jgi:hypothetical protein